MLKAFCELSENGKRIDVFFHYSAEAVLSIKRIPGSKWHPDPPKHWSIPADYDAARRLREEFGEGLELGQAVNAWGREARRAARNISELTFAEDATLNNISKESAAWLRPYQRADAAHMAVQSVINANQPGVGKTVETIYAIQESGVPGPHLVVCPASLFKDPWRDELAAHAPHLRVMYGDDSAQRRGSINYTWMEFKDGRAEDIILLLNPEMIRVKKWMADELDILAGTPAGKALVMAKLSADHKGNIYVPKDALDVFDPEKGNVTGADSALFDIQWGYVVADEFHKFGLGGDRNTLYARGLEALRKRSKMAAALSGTPMGGKPIRLWGPLNFIEPEMFSSKWRWAEMWLNVEEGDYGKRIGGMQMGRQQEFDDAHKKYMIRRTRATALPGLPPKVIIDVEVEMTKKQAKVYNTFMRDAEVLLEGSDRRVVANITLAEYARAKQFANALCEIRDGQIQPTLESGKLPILLDRLDTYGVRKEDPEPNARAIVASESQRFVVLLESYLAGAGIDVRRLDGTVKNSAKNPARDAVIDWYKEKSDGARVLVMTTQTGGVGLNLGMTGSIHIMDETWNPDDQEQLEDRGMRNRDTSLMVLYYRTKDTIQEYIHEINQGKAVNNKNIVELREQIRLRGPSGA